MKILLDAMGGDNAPAEIIKGAALAAAEYPDAEITLIGNTKAVNASAAENGIDLTACGVKLVHAETAVAMDDPPLSVRRKKDSSMYIGCHLVADGSYDAFVCAGSTGALYTAASLFIGRIPGVTRSGIGTILPLSNPVLLLDAGANTKLESEDLLMFAEMGSAYMQGVFDIDNPRVGLLNNGTEEEKGTDLQKAAYPLLKSAEQIRFVGNIEGKEVPFDACDVLVTDGFTGNVLLKTMEGAFRFMMVQMKGMFGGDPLHKAGGLLYKGKAKDIKRKFDASEYGGAPILGIRRPVIKAHGSSDANAVKNAVGQAIRYAESGMIEKLAEREQKEKANV